MHNSFLVKEINGKKILENFFAIFFSVQKGNHNYDLQIFKNLQKIGPQIQFIREKWWETKEGKSQLKN